MNTIRSKISLLFALVLVFAGFLTVIYYQNIISLKEKLITIENFDDLLNDILELRRYEKNFVYYHDVASLEDTVFYLFKIEDAFESARKDIQRVAGEAGLVSFRKYLDGYRHTLEINVSSAKSGKGTFHVQEIRTKGKALVDITQDLIEKKRRRINEAMGYILAIPLASLAAFVLLSLLVFHLVNRGILRPLSLLRKATDQVAKGTFTPITYQEGKKDEISLLIGAFNTMAQEIQSKQEQLLQSRKLASIGTLTSGIAHELNNPINNISLTAETLKYGYHDLSDEEMNELIDDILTQAERASKVVKNLLEFSRSDRPIFTRLDITEVIDKTINLIRNQLVIGGINLETHYDKDLPPINGKI
ncbi:MAG: HAMP domain-containing histidine kinase, partial [Deltaproteobacteria bacterium]|nr:HAMP domain-containing histidine kinase [Deltaproteobacteria bacterium]